MAESSARQRNRATAGMQRYTAAGIDPADHRDPLRQPVKARAILRRDREAQLVVVATGCGLRRSAAARDRHRIEIDRRRPRRSLHKGGRDRRPIHPTRRLPQSRCRAARVPTRVAVPEGSSGAADSSGRFPSLRATSPCRAALRGRCVRARAAAPPNTPLTQTRSFSRAPRRVSASPATQCPCTLTQMLRGPRARLPPAIFTPKRAAAAAYAMRKSFEPLGGSVGKRQRDQRVVRFRTHRREIRNADADRAETDEVGRRQQPGSARRPPECRWN